MSLVEESLSNFRCHMFFEVNRRETFKNWIYPDDKPCNARKLSEAGFYYVGTKQEPDCVQCFLCDKSLDGWEENDDPWKEHISHQSNCSFAKLQKPEYDQTKREQLAIYKELIQRIVNKSYEEKVNAIKERFERCRSIVKRMK